MLMANLQIRNMPDDLHARIAERAREQGITMSEYALRLLRADLARPSIASWVEQVRAGSASQPRVDVDAALEIERARDTYDPDDRVSDGVRR